MLKPEFKSMLSELSVLPGGEVVAGLADTLETTSPAVGIRLNPRKPSEPAVAMRPVPWSLNGYWIDGERPAFTFDPALHQGLYYVQDPSSMVIGHIVRRLTEGRSPLVYIDACAAPGGKTTAAIDALPDGSLVIANEYDRRRAAALCENLAKWGCPATAVSCGDTRALRSLGPIADIVAVDAPCSGEGMMRKESVAVDQWTDALTADCALLQREILTNAWEALRPGGYLIYSTCTFNRRENEDNLAWLVGELGAEPVAIDLPADVGIAAGIDTPYPAARFIPGRIEGEGLFIAVVRKPEGSQTDADSKQRREERRNAKSKGAKPDPALLQAAGLLAEPDNYTITRQGDNIIATPRRWDDIFSLLRRNLSLLQAGVEIAGVKGRDLIPSQPLALAGIAAEGSFPTAEVDDVTAIAYLRRESIAIPEAPRGFVLLTYGGRPLGFVKNLGNRANNLYPASWAIRSTHIPSPLPRLVR